MTLEKIHVCSETLLKKGFKGVFYVFGVTLSRGDALETNYVPSQLK